MKKYFDCAKESIFFFFTVVILLLNFNCFWENIYLASKHFSFSILLVQFSKKILTSAKRLVIKILSTFIYVNYVAIDIHFCKNFSNLLFLFQIFFKLS